MPLTPTTNLGLSRPAPGDPADVSGDLEVLTDQLDAGVAPRASHTFPGALGTGAAFTAAGVVNAQSGAISPARILTISASTHTLVAGDLTSNYLRFTNAAGCVVTLNAGVAPLGFEWNLVFRGSTVGISFVEGTNVDIFGVDSKKKITKPYGGGTLIYDRLNGSTEEWIIFGGDAT